MYYLADLLLWRKVSISGPPPPARLDHAMCAIKIPVRPAQPAQPAELELQARREQTGFLDEAECLQTCESSERPFQAVTIINPEVAMESNFSVTKPPAMANGQVSRESKVAGSSDIAVATGGIAMATGDVTVATSNTAMATGDIAVATGDASAQGTEWISAVFVFGGIDTRGNLHGDTFILVP